MSSIYRTCYPGLRAPFEFWMPGQDFTHAAERLALVAATAKSGVEEAFGGQELGACHCWEKLFALF